MLWLHKLWFYLRVHGAAKTWNRLAWHLRRRLGRDDYARWLARYDRGAPKSLPAPDLVSVLREGESLDAAEGRFVLRLAPGDVLAPNALAWIAAALAAHPDTEILYADEDALDEAGRRQAPRFKPDWDPELLLGDDYLGRMVLCRTDLARAAGGGTDVTDLVLRLLERGATRIRHIPRILLHCAAPPPPAALATVAEHLRRIGSPATVTAEPDGRRRLHHPLPEPAPLVSLLVPTRDRIELLRPCLEGLLHGTDYPALEVLVLDNGSREPATLAYFEELRSEPRVRVLALPGPFNFSALNNAGVAAARGELVGFINNDIQVIEPGWLREMAAQALRPGIGAVGAKLLYGDGTVQHGGVILGIGGVGAHAHRRFPGDAPGYCGRLRVVQSFSAVTAACLVMRKALFEQVGGFDAEHLAVAFNDVDLCLRLGQAGYRILWTPFAELHHLESISRGGDFDADKRRRFRAETEWMRHRWGPVLDADPCYNPNLTLHACDFGLSYPPRQGP